MIKVYKQNESYAFIDCDYDEACNISEKFSFFADNYFFSPKYKSGVWDGKIRLFNKQNGLIPIGLIPSLIAWLDKYNIPAQIDKDLNEDGIKIKSDSIDSFLKKFYPFQYNIRDYQSKAVQIALYMKKSIILSPTASGKSYIIFTIFNILKHINKDFNFLLIVPNVSLVEQMESDFIEYAESDNNYSDLIHKIYSGKDKTLKKQITISTWQTLQNFPEGYFKKFNCVVCDEVHLATGAELSNIMSNCINAEFKIGLTGTLTNSKINKLQLQGLFGSIFRVANTKNLMDKGVLSDLKIIGIKLVYSPKVRSMYKAMTWETEKEFLHNRMERISLINKLVSQENKNSLVMFKYKEYGMSLHKLISLAHPDKKVYYVDGTVPALDREKIRKECEIENNVIIVASYATFGTGINIKRLHNMIFAESSKSIIKILQAIGRLLRKHNTKEFAILYDIGDYIGTGKSLNHTYKHYLYRQEIYTDQKFNFKEKIIELSK